MEEGEAMVGMAGDDLDYLLRCTPLASCWYIDD